ELIQKHDGRGRSPSLPLGRNTRKPRMVVRSSVVDRRCHATGVTCGSIPGLEVRMKLSICCCALLLCSVSVRAQAPETKFIADTLVVQADGTYESDPDLATLTFQIFSQDKDLKHAYDAASQSMQRIAGIAQRNGLQKEDVSTGVLTVAPLYDGDRKKRARSYYVRGDCFWRPRFCEDRAHSRRVG